MSYTTRFGRDLTHIAILKELRKSSWGQLTTTALHKLPYRSDNISAAITRLVERGQVERHRFGKEILITLKQSQ